MIQILQFLWKLSHNCQAVPETRSGIAFFYIYLAPGMNASRYQQSTWYSSEQEAAGIPLLVSSGPASRFDMIAPSHGRPLCMLNPIPCEGALCPVGIALKSLW